METRLVYRVEKADADHGPFEGEGSFTLSNVMEDAGWVDSNGDGYFHAPDRGFPGPANDPGLRRRWFDTAELDGYVCGCRSARQLARWFPAPLAEYLDREGYELTVWEVPRKRVAHGRTQVMFDRDAAECLARHPVTSLHA